MSQSRKVVLITGCSQGGIGSALCEEFAEQGCKVYATSRNVVTMDGFKHPNIQLLALDVTSDDDVQRIVKTVHDDEGKIDIVVNNAGILAVGAIIDIPIEQVKRTFDTNTFAALRMAKAVIPYMTKRKSGLIINIGSIVGNTPTPWNGLYAASKAALHSITEVLYMECKPFNVNVMLVAPGAITSNIAKNHKNEFSLPEGSLYSSYLQQIIARMNASQGKHSMPAEVFAKQVVEKSLKRTPPQYIVLGGNAFLASLLLWVPRTWALWLMWRMFSRPRK